MGTGAKPGKANTVIRTWSAIKREDHIYYLAKDNYFTIYKIVRYQDNLKTPSQD